MKQCYQVDLDLIPGCSFVRLKLNKDREFIRYSGNGYLPDYHNWLGSCKPLRLLRNRMA